MSKFNPSPKKLVVNELIEQGYTVDYDDALRLCHELEEEQQTDGKIAIGLTAVGIIGAGVTLAFCGAVAPLLVPIAAIGVGMSGVWNHPIRATRRDDEADFLRANPSIVPLIEAKLHSGEAPFKVAAAYLECFRAWRTTGQPLALPSVGNVPSDESPAIATSSPIGTATKLGAVEVPSSPAAQNAPSLNMNSGSKGFDWHRLNTDYNDFPHLFLLGKTGAGKSYVSDRLVRFLNGYCIVISPKKMPADFQGLQVVGLPYDYRAIHRALVALEKLMVEREAEMQRTGFTDFQPINVILDELPVSSSGCKDLDLDLLKPLKALIRAGRTSKIRLIILAQGSEVKALGIEGEGGLRDSLTYVYLKGFVEDYAAKSKIDISQVDRPCIIDGEIADTSFLAQFIDTYRAGLDVTGQAARTKDTLYHKLAGDIPGTAEHLEKLFKLPDAEEGEATDDETAIEQSGTVIEISSDLGNYIKSRPDVTLWNVSSIKRANKKFRRHDDATLTKAFQILALSDRGEWDGESFRPA